MTNAIQNTKTKVKQISKAIIDRVTNDKGLIPVWFIVITLPLPGTVALIAFNAAIIAKNRATPATPAT